MQKMPGKNDMNQSLRVSDYMATELLTLTPEMDLRRALAIFIEADISGAPVIGPRGELIGMLTERDCIRQALNAGYYDEPGGTVESCMSTTVVTVGGEDRLMDVALRFRDSHFRRYPVVDDGQLVGLISRRDVLRAMQDGAWFAGDH